MQRLALLSFILVISLPIQAKNVVQKLYNEVNKGVVELHIKALAEPKPGQVIHKTTMSGSLGSGVVISDEGRILTAAHVVDRATEIEIIFADGSKSSGHVVWVDSLIDLAMIQASKMPKDLKALPLAKSGDYNIGDQLIIIGAPFGVSHSLSVGYLSGVRDREQIPGTSIIPRFLQTDAAINVGNSGGPMFNLDGEVIGIVSHILSKTGGSNGLGFAVSIDTVHDVIDSEPSNFSGFIPLLLTEQLSDALNNPFGYGMLVQQVIPGTLADKLGFQGGHVNVLFGRTPVLLGGDILLSIDGIPLKGIESAIKVKQRFSDANKGDQIVFRYLRDGVEKRTSWIVD
jgi:serine protease Do